MAKKNAEATKTKEEKKNKEATKTKFFDRAFFKVAKSTIVGFLSDKGLKLSAALAYYTIFALAPLLLLLISLVGIFFGKEATQGKIFEELNGLIGSSAALQVQDMIKAIELSDKSTIALIIGVFTLILGATSIFGEIQDSINIIWKVKAKPEKGWLKLLKDRLLSSSLIVSLGFLLIVSLIANGVILALMDRLSRYLPDMTVFIANVLNTVISFFVITVLFGTIFKVLPDAKIKWSDVRSGAIFTACLFLIGRFLIGLYISTTATGSTFGAAGSLIVVLVWIYYTAVILYLGAEFTQVYTEFRGRHIEPAEFAVAVVQKEIEKDVEVLPKQHDDLPKEKE